MTPDHAARAVDDRDLWLLQMAEAGHTARTIVMHQRCGTCSFWQGAQCRWTCKCAGPCEARGRSIKAHDKGRECWAWSPIPESDVAALLADLVPETEAA